MAPPRKKSKAPPIKPASGSRTLAAATGEAAKVAGQNAAERRLRRLRRVCRSPRAWCSLVCCCGLAVGVAMTLTAYAVLLAARRADAAAAFAADTYEVANLLRINMLTPTLLFAQLVADLDASRAPVTTPQFRDAAMTTLTRMPAFSDIAALRPLPHAQRAAWEARMTAAHGRNITVRNENGTLSEARPVYYVVEALTASPNTSRIGGDVGAQATQLGAIEATMRSPTGGSFVAPPFTIGSSSSSPEAFMSLYRPVHWWQEGASIPPVSAPAQLGTYTHDAGGVPLPGDVQAARPAPSSTFRSGVAVQYVVQALFRGGTLTQLLIDGVENRQAGAQLFFTSGNLRGKVAALLCEDVQDVPGVSAIPGVPLNLMSPIFRTSTVAYGHGIPFLGAVQRDGGLVSALNGPLVKQMMDDGLRDGSQIVDRYILGFGTRRLMLTMLSSRSYLRDAYTDVAIAVLPIGLCLTAVLSGLLAFGVYMLQAARLSRERASRLRHKQLTAAQRMEDRMLGLLSHELRNPAHVITSTALFLLDMWPEDRDGRPEMEIIAESSETLHRLIADVLAFSAARIGQVQLKFATMDLRAFVHRLALRHRSLAQVPIRWIVDAAAPVAMITDAMRVSQILTNGLVNAAKFCLSGTITIRVGVQTSVAPGAATGDTPARVIAVDADGDVSVSGVDGRSVVDAASQVAPASPPEAASRATQAVVFTIEDTGPGPGERRMGLWEVGDAHRVTAPLVHHSCRSRARQRRVWCHGRRRDRGPRG
jgi:signal transduction histidine kinase